MQPAVNAMHNRAVAAQAMRKFDGVGKGDHDARMLCYCIQSILSSGCDCAIPHHSQVNDCEAFCFLLQNPALEIVPAAAAVADSGSHGGVFIGEPASTQSIATAAEEVDMFVSRHKNTSARPMLQLDSLT